ncbi:MAG: hypothetical protein GEU28_10820 [Dehalococcoidia bacterium]|nr:hypothetical protein [Dehalococcoidia bacterium]
MAGGAPYCSDCGHPVAADAARSGGGLAPSLPLAALIAGICGALVLIGSVGPWVRAAFVSVSGTEGDGMLTLLLGGLAVFGALVRVMQRRGRGIMLLTLVSLGLAGVIGIYHWTNLETSVDSDSIIEVQIGWGLVLVTFASIAGGIAALVDCFGSSGTRRPTAPAQPADPIR